MMTLEKVVGPNIDSDMREPAKKEWRRPGLQKLPIAATAAGTHVNGNDGNGAKNGSAGSIS
jgi:hypothetical protein